MTVTVDFPPPVGTLFFGASEDSPDLEQQCGHILGIYREYYQSGQTSALLAYARTQANKHGLPMVSIKPPGTWAAVANGSFDSWVAHIITGLRAIDKPVLWTINHEPENDTQGAGSGMTAADFVALCEHVNGMHDYADLDAKIWFGPCYMSGKYNPAAAPNPNARLKLENWCTSAMGRMMSYDAYNHFDPASGKPWRSVSDTVNWMVNGGTFNGVVIKGLNDIVPTKPQIHAEWGVRDDPNDATRAPAWMQELYDWHLANGTVGMSYFSSAQNVNDGGATWKLVGVRLAKFKHILTELATSVFLGSQSDGTDPPDPPPDDPPDPPPPDDPPPVPDPPPPDDWPGAIVPPTQVFHTPTDTDWPEPVVPWSNIDSDYFTVNSGDDFYVYSGGVGSLSPTSELGAGNWIIASHGGGGDIRATQSFDADYSYAGNYIWTHETLKTVPNTATRTIIPVDTAHMNYSDLVGSTGALMLRVEVLSGSIEIDSIYLQVETPTGLWILDGGEMSGPVVPDHVLDSGLVMYHNVSSDNGFAGTGTVHGLDDIGASTAASMLAGLTSAGLNGTGTPYTYGQSLVSTSSFGTAGGVTGTSASTEYRVEAAGVPAANVYYSHNIISCKWDNPDFRTTPPELSNMNYPMDYIENPDTGLLVEWGEGDTEAAAWKEPTWRISQLADLVTDGGDVANITIDGVADSSYGNPDAVSYSLYVMGDEAPTTVNFTDSPLGSELSTQNIATVPVALPDLSGLPLKFSIEMRLSTDSIASPTLLPLDRFSTPDDGRYWTYRASITRSDLQMYVQMPTFRYFIPHWVRSGDSVGGIGTPPGGGGGDGQWPYPPGTDPVPWPPPPINPWPGYPPFDPYPFDPIPEPPPYTYITFDLSNNGILSEVEFQDVSYSHKLSRPGQASFSLPVNPTTIKQGTKEATTPGRTGVYVIRDDQIMWGGIIWKRQYDSRSRAVRFEAETFESYFDHRLNAIVLSYENVDQLTIARGFANQAADEVHIDVDDTMSGVLRYLNAFPYEFKRIGSEISGLASLFNGFDWNIHIYPDPTDGVIKKRLIWGYPTLGVTADTTQFQFEYPGNIRSYTTTDDADNSGNRIFAIGGGEGLDQIWKEARDDLALASGWPIMEYTTTYKDIFNLTMLDERAQQDLKRLHTPVSLVTATVIPDGDPNLGQYFAGDWARFVIEDSWNFEGIDKFYRIVGYSVAVSSDTPVETVTLDIAIGDEET